MVAPIQPSGPLSGIHPEVIAAVVFFAERQATLTAASLDAIIAEASCRGDSFDGRGLPVGFLLELGAAAQLNIWETDGLRPLLPTDVPSYKTASTDLYARVQADPLQFRNLASATLSKRVLRLWIERFCWSAPMMLDVDVTIDRIDEDLLIEAAAQLLWKHRRTAHGSTS